METITWRFHMLTFAGTSGRLLQITAGFSNEVVSFLPQRKSTYLHRHGEEVVALWVSSFSVALMTDPQGMLALFVCKESMEYSETQ